MSTTFDRDTAHCRGSYTFGDVWESKHQDVRFHDIELRDRKRKPSQGRTVYSLYVRGRRQGNVQYDSWHQRWITASVRACETAEELMSALYERELVRKGTLYALAA